MPPGSRSYEPKLSQREIKRPRMMEIPTGLGITRRIGEEKTVFLLKFLGKMQKKWETIAVALNCDFYEKLAC